MGIRISVTREPHAQVPHWRRLTTRSLVATLVALGLMGAAGGVAIASIPDPGTGVFHGCYSTTTGALRLVDPSTGHGCKVGEKAVSWDQAGVTWRGAWSATTTYNVHDAVVYQGSSYLATKANTNNVPPSSPNAWSLLAAAGKTGATGATGPLSGQRGSNRTQGT